MQISSRQLGRFTERPLTGPVQAEESLERVVSRLGRSEPQPTGDLAVATVITAALSLI